MTWAPNYHRFYLMYNSDADFRNKAAKTNAYKSVARSLYRMNDEFKDGKWNGEYLCSLRRINN